MKTIKIIDLLNMIANKEYDKLPKTIEYNYVTYHKRNTSKNMNFYSTENTLYRELLKEINSVSKLNDEVEIIEDTEEDNKIEKIRTDFIEKRKYLCDDISMDFLKADLMCISSTLNEVIDKLNSLNLHEIEVSDEKI